jgi:transcription factor C subunit 6
MDLPEYGNLPTLLLLLTVSQVVDVQIDQKSGLYPLKLDSACFTARVSGLLATCLTWLSATDLAIGHSDGQLAIFNIYENGNSDTPCLHNPAIPGISYPNTAANALPLEPVPWLSIGLHPSYILDLTSAYPTYPALLISTSASGNLRLTSLLAPMTDFVLSNRTRSPPSSVAYHDGLLSVVGMEESSETIRLWGLRCFYTSVGIGKLTGPPGYVFQVVTLLVPRL